MEAVATVQPVNWQLLQLVMTDYTGVLITGLRGKESIRCQIRSRVEGGDLGWREGDLGRRGREREISGRGGREREILGRGREGRCGREISGRGRQGRGWEREISGKGRGRVEERDLEKREGGGRGRIAAF